MNTIEYASQGHKCSNIFVPFVVCSIDTHEQYKIISEVYIMLKKIILSKYQRSQLNLWITANQIMDFYDHAFSQPETPNIPYTFLRYNFHIMDYLWDIHEEIDLLKSIDEDTTKLQALYSKLQSLREHAI